MMSDIPLETCWAFNVLWNNKFRYQVASCWLLLLSQYKIYSLHQQGKVSPVDISFYLCPLSRAGCYFSPGTGIAVLVRAKGFHWTICTLFSVSFFKTDWLCLSSIAHFTVPFYITSHYHNCTLSMQYVPHFLAVYCAHSSFIPDCFTSEEKPVKSQVQEVK